MTVPSTAVDMDKMDWRGLMRGLFKFLSEEAREPEHQARDADFEENKHPRDHGKFASAPGGNEKSSEKDEERFGVSGSVASKLKKAVPQLMHFKHQGPREAKRVTLHNGQSYVEPASPHHWLMASTESNNIGIPVTIPGHKTATGVAIKVNPKTKHIHFSEINSHIKGAGQKIVESIIKQHPDYTFSALDWSHDEGKPSGQSFWEKMQSKYPNKFAHDDQPAMMTPVNAGIPAAGVMLVDPLRHVLFVKRSKAGDHEGTWCFPGGRCEDEETADDCARRETREEVGYDCAMLAPAHQHTFDGVDFTTFAHAVPRRFRPRLNDEHVAYVWAPWGAWPEPLHPGVAAALQSLQDDVEEGNEADLDDAGGFEEGGSDASPDPPRITHQNDRTPFTERAIEDLPDNRVESMSRAVKRDMARVPSDEQTRTASDSMALDRDSSRSYDADGRLHVQASNISKATVNPYVGREIPDYEKLGLDPDKKYMLLRDPDELAKAAPTFNNLPILSRHVPVSADSHQPDLVVGSTGTDAEYRHPYLRNSKVIWAKPAIDGVERGDTKELSSAYRYKADMTPGSYEGQHYDGVMRDIVGNHVALVKSGRAGPDVVVGDSAPKYWRAPVWKARSATTAYADRRW